MSQTKKVEIKFKSKKDTLKIKFNDEKLSNDELMALYIVVQNVLSERMIREEFHKDK